MYRPIHMLTDCLRQESFRRRHPLTLHLQLLFVFLMIGFISSSVYLLASIDFIVELEKQGYGRPKPPKFNFF